MTAKLFKGTIKATLIAGLALLTLFLVDVGSARLGVSSGCHFTIWNDAASWVWNLFESLRGIEDDVRDGEEVENPFCVYY